jgi:mycofactocin precursor
MGDLELKQTAITEDLKNSENDDREGKVFSTVEILIEEMAIDGICGVY